MDISVAYDVVTVNTDIEIDLGYIFDEVSDTDLIAHVNNDDLIVDEVFERGLVSEILSRLDDEDFAMEAHSRGFSDADTVEIPAEVRDAFQTILDFIRNEPVTQEGVRFV